MAANSSRRNRRRPCPHCRRRQRRLLIIASCVVSSIAGLTIWAATGFNSPAQAQATDAIGLHQTFTHSTTSYVAPNQQEIRELLGQIYPQVPPATKTPTHRVARSTPSVTASTNPTPTETPTQAYTAPPKQTPTATHTYTPPPSNGSLAARLLATAETQQGIWYVYGGDSPGTGFDCSGLIYWSALQIGISNMPRDTYSMLGQGVSSGLLVPTGNPQPGDLAFFGSGHVELYVSPGVFFGAQQTGTQVGFHNYGAYYPPTAYYSIT